MASFYLSREASEARVRALGPALAERLGDKIKTGRDDAVLEIPSLYALAWAFLFDPADEHGDLSRAIEDAAI